MQSIKAVYDGVGFSPKQPIPVTVDYEVIITFIEPVKKESPNTHPKLPRSTAKGLLKGKVWMAEDFDEPIEELKDYME